MRLHGGPCAGRVYDFPEPLAAAYAINDDRGQLHTYAADWQAPTTPGRYAERIYRHEGSATRDIVRRT